MYEQRNYARGGHFNGTASVSADGETWCRADIEDVSSGGLKLRSETAYNEGDVLWFDIVLQGFLSEFEVKAKGQVCHRQPFADKYIYGIAFMGLSREKQIQIDLNVQNDRPIAGAGYEADE